LAIEGTYSIEIETPLGIMPGKLVLKVDGNSIKGICTTQMGTQSLTGSLVSDQEVLCSTKINSPLGELDLQITGKFRGNEISGHAKAEGFGSFSFKGKKD